MREIKVPRVTPKAFDKNRRASDLLQKQVAQLAHVVEVTRGTGVVTMSAKRVKTEGQAAKFISEATRALNIVPRPEPAAAAAPAPAAPGARSPATRTPARAAGGGSRTRPAKPARSYDNKKKARAKARRLR